MKKLFKDLKIGDRFDGSKLRIKISENTFATEGNHCPVLYADETMEVEVEDELTFGNLEIGEDFIDLVLSQPEYRKTQNFVTSMNNNWNAVGTNGLLYNFKPEARVRRVKDA